MHAISFGQQLFDGGHGEGLLDHVVHVHVGKILHGAVLEDLLLEEGAVVLGVRGGLGLIVEEGGGERAWGDEAIEVVLFLVELVPHVR